MSKTFWGFFAVALVVVAALVAVVWFGNASHHLVVKGTILNVRTLEAGAGGSIAIVDFRLKNSSGVPFVVRDVETTMEPVSGEVATSIPVSKSDVDAVFAIHSAVGPKFHEPLSVRDKIGAGDTSDWMVAAHFDLPESALKKRKTMHIHIQDVDGAEVELTETP